MASNQRREDWLKRLADAMAPELLSRANVTLPPFRVTCGFPSRGGELGRKKRVAGQCWDKRASDDGHAEVFISPVEDEVEAIASIMAHELIHAGLGSEAAHGPAFQAAARRIGHIKPFTGCTVTPAFLEWARPLLETAGPYPHSRLNAHGAIGQKKKQGARLLKAKCEACGYTVRVTRKWVEIGPPHCPEHGAMAVDGGDDGEG